MECPCGSDKVLDECCGPIIAGEAKAATAEALMRARYAAYATNKTEFVIDTHDPETRDELDVKATRRWAEGNDWLGLEILETEAGGKDDDEGIVEFVVTFSDERDRTQTHHERSEFVRRDGDWHFHDGEIVVKEPVRSEKVGRNEPCPCGSGKKYKKCHGRPGAD
ncbi:MAG: YchJ family protein [Deltaproteobacteria bacterium]|nr:YchJ family protein [Deltaproteobacteria bacterium]